MLIALAGLLIVALVFMDAFEATVLPRRITRRLRFTRLFYRATWWAWRRFADLLPPGRHRQNILSVFGPLSLLALFVCWVAILIAAFALIHWGLGTLPSPAGDLYAECLYSSGETFFTLGYGDITPVTSVGKALAVVEAGTGFAFMAIIIGYVPVFYQTFSRREQNIAMLDARAGSPPTAGELFRRAGRPDQCPEIERYLAEWEAWSADLLESHLSYPLLAYYRSQHDNQSWLAALALMLDASAALVVTGREQTRRRAEVTFAIARHACVDTCLMFWLPPQKPLVDRLTDAELASLCAYHSESPNALKDVGRQLRELRDLYEPFLESLAQFFNLVLPRFFPDRPAADNWQSTAWTKRAPNITDLPGNPRPPVEHFG